MEITLIIIEKLFRIIDKPQVIEAIFIVISWKLLAKNSQGKEAFLNGNSKVVVPEITSFEKFEKISEDNLKEIVLTKMQTKTDGQIKSEYERYTEILENKINT